MSHSPCTAVNFEHSVVIDRPVAAPAASPEDRGGVAACEGAFAALFAPLKSTRAAMCRDGP